MNTSDGSDQCPAQPSDLAAGYWTCCCRPIIVIDRTPPAAPAPDDRLTVLQKKLALDEERIALYEETIEHLQKQCSQAAALPFRTFTAQVLEYLTAVDNAAREKTDLATLSRFIRIYTENLLVNLRAVGVTASWHEPDSELGDGRLDIREVATTDPAADGRVARSERFGCSFRDGREQPLPERVAVYRYKAAAAPAAGDTENDRPAVPDESLADISPAVPAVGSETDRIPAPAVGDAAGPVQDHSGTDRPAESKQQDVN